MSNNKKQNVMLNVSLAIMVACTCISLVAMFEQQALYERREQAMLGQYVPPGVLPRPPSYHRVNPLPPGGGYSKHFEVKLDPECNNVVTRIAVPAGGAVWSTIKAQIAENERKYPPYDGPETNAQLEALTKRTVDDLQERINADPSLKVRDLNHVPVGYQIDLAEDTSVSPVPGQ